jgi:AraC-like DNA-binding protein
MMRLVHQPPRGILRPEAIADKFELGRYAPAPEHAWFVEHYWTVRWDLRGQPPYLSETLPYPVVHLVVDEAAAQLWGVVKTRFGYLLEDQGGVFGIKFRPGGIKPLVPGSVARLTSRVVDAGAALGPEWEQLARRIRAAGDDAARTAVADQGLRALAPPHDPNVDLVNRVVERIVADRSLTRVETIAADLGCSVRSLQRLFSTYVGVGPKWVIGRYRLHEAADLLTTQPDADLLTLALNLGYFDQAHFIKDFKAIVGEPPGEYARRAGQAVS